MKIKQLYAVKTYYECIFDVDQTLVNKFIEWTSSCAPNVPDVVKNLTVEQFCEYVLENPLLEDVTYDYDIQDDDGEYWNGTVSLIDEIHQFLETQFENEKGQIYDQELTDSTYVKGDVSFDFD